MDPRNKDQRAAWKLICCGHAANESKTEKCRKRTNRVAKRMEKKNDDQFAKS